MQIDLFKKRIANSIDPNQVNFKKFEEKIKISMLDEFHAELRLENDNHWEEQMDNVK